MIARSTANARLGVLALIPARGGSKGIPRKNLIELLGQPLISYSIQQALASNVITRVIVSTDSEEIASVSREWGAETPFMRPDEFSTDMSPDLEAFQHALMWLKEHERYEPEAVVHLRPTGPVRKVEVIDSAAKTLLNDPEADSLRSIAPAQQTPYKMWHIDGDYLRPVATIDGMPDAQSMPRQSLPQVWWQNGYVDVVRPRAILEHKTMAGQKALPFIIDEPRYELDYMDDIPVVEDALRRLLAGELNHESKTTEERYSV